MLAFVTKIDAMAEIMIYPNVIARGFIGVAFLLLMSFITKSKISFKDIKNNLLLLVISCAFIGFNWILLFESYRFTTVATATLCYYLAPTFIIIDFPYFS